MFNNNTDKEWENIGRDDPYFGVSTTEKFLTKNLTDGIKEGMFKSGSYQVDQIYKVIKNHIDPNFIIKNALDFGCGVGRIVIPLSFLAETVTGVDISASMINEAKRNCKAKSIENVTFVLSNDNLSLVTGKFNFIYSFCVFQHIPKNRGEQIFTKLLSHLEDGGVGVLHFLYAKDYHFKKIVPWIKKYIPFSKYIINVLKGKNILSKQMQMNSYNLNRVLYNIQKSNVSEFHAEYTNHNGELGIVLFFKKGK